MLKKIRHFKQYNAKNLLLKELENLNDPDKKNKIIWNNIKIQKIFLSIISKELNITTFEDWYKIKLLDIIEKGGKGLIYKYKNSLYNLLKNLYPEYNWKPWLFLNAPHNFWDEEENQKLYLKWFEEQLKIEKMDDWYKIKKSDLMERGGSGLLFRYKNSLYKLLSTLYSQYDWKPWLFHKVPQSFWNNKENIRWYIQWLSEKLNIKKLDDWYQFSKYCLEDNQGGGLLKSFNGSLLMVLKTVYPDYDWKPWLLNNSPKSFWSQTESINSYIKWLENQLEIKTLDDWYNVSANDISKYFQGGRLLNKYGGLKAFLLHYYPNHKWNLELLESNSKRLISKAQYRLIRVIEKIFPNENIEINYKHPLLFNENTKGQMEFDIYLPSLNLAFEYQGEQHYFNHYLYGNCTIAQIRDQNKIKLCKKVGITLIIIPYWWDRNMLSLKATIQQYKPDLILNIENSFPIPETNKKQFSHNYLNINFQFLEALELLLK